MKTPEIFNSIKSTEYALKTVRFGHYFEMGYRNELRESAGRFDYDPDLDVLKKITEPTFVPLSLDLTGKIEKFGYAFHGTRYNVILAIQKFIESFTIDILDPLDRDYEKKRKAIGATRRIWDCICVNSWTASEEILKQKMYRADPYSFALRKLLGTTSKVLPVHTAVAHAAKSAMKPVRIGARVLARKVQDDTKGINPFGEDFKISNPGQPNITVISANEWKVIDDDRYRPNIVWDASRVTGIEIAECLKQFHDASNERWGLTSTPAPVKRKKKTGCAAVGGDIVGSMSEYSANKKRLIENRYGPEDRAQVRRFSALVNEAIKNYRLGSFHMRSKASLQTATCIRQIIIDPNKLNVTHDMRYPRVGVGADTEFTNPLLELVGWVLGHRGDVIIVAHDPQPVKLEKGKRLYTLLDQVYRDFKL